MVVKAWRTAGQQQQEQGGESEEWPPQSTWQARQTPARAWQQKGGNKQGRAARHLPQPGQGKASIPSASFSASGNDTVEVDDGDYDTPLSKKQKTEDLVEVEPRPGETEREAKVRVMAERIRAEAKRAHGEPGNAGGASALKQMPSKRSAQASVATKQKEERDAQRLEAMLPIMEEIVSTAEDEAEKVAILAAPLSIEAMEELQELQLTAIRDTERAVKAAMITVSKARRELAMRKKEAESMVPFVRDSAREEIAKLTIRLDDAQSKLDEHKSVRRDHELALQAEKLFGELASRLATVEVDCERAAMMAEPLAKVVDANPEEINSSEVRETKEALRIARATLAPTMRLIAGKVAGLKGTVREKMLDLQSRAEASHALLDKAQRTVEESESRAAALPIVKQAAERIANVEDMLQKMRETEAPFLMGLETMPPEEAAEVLMRMDRSASVAQAALAEAHKYVALKVVEVGLLAEGAGETARRELEKLRHQVDEGIERVKAFQVEAAKRRRANIVEVVKVKIEEAEGAVNRMKEAGAELETSDPGALARLLEKAHAAELEAQNAVTSARRELQERQQDLRPLEGGHPEVLKNSSEILRTKTRVNYMEAELTKFRKIAKGFEEKIRVGRSLVGLLESLKEAEKEVESISATSKPPKGGSKPQDEVNKIITSVQAKLSSLTVQVDMKLQTSQGLEQKELKDISSRIQQAQQKLDKVKDVAREQNRSVSKQAVKDAAQAMQTAEAEVATLSSSTASLEDTSVASLEDIYEKACVVNKLIEDAQKAVANVQGLDTQAKVEFARLQIRLKGVERKGKAATETISAKFESTASEATQKMLDTLRSAGRRDDGSYDLDKLFLELSDGTGEITDMQLRSFVESSTGDLEMSPDEVTLALKRIAPYGLTRRTFAWVLATFFKALRDVTMTDEFEVQSTKKIRKLESGEVVEVLGEAKQDGNLSIERVQCRALRDGIIGWATARSMAGTSDLELTHKPFLWCTRKLAMRTSEEADSALVRNLQAGEVLELLEGPHDERLGSELRVRGVTCGEESTGWLQIRDKEGTTLAKLSSTVYKCTEAIAMTDIADLGSCTLMRRVNAGEALELLPEEEVRPKEGGTRRRFRACKDGAEGWITTSGSQGTSYVRLAQRHYVCTQAAPVHTGLAAESLVLRLLMPGEAFAAFEEPKEVSGGERLSLYRVRTLTDSMDGWVTCTAAGEVLSWSGRHRISKGTDLTKGFTAELASEGMDVVRFLEAGEIIEVYGIPMEDSLTGRLRVRCAALKDNAKGWTTVREDSSVGSLILQPVGVGETSAGEEAARELGEDDAATMQMRATLRAELMGTKRQEPIGARLGKGPAQKRPTLGGRW